jgi:hypothetical protein
MKMSVFWQSSVNSANSERIFMAVTIEVAAGDPVGDCILETHFFCVQGLLGLVNPVVSWHL